MKIARRGHKWRAEALGWEEDVSLPIRRSELIFFRFLKRNLKKGSSLSQKENCFPDLCEVYLT